MALCKKVADGMPPLPPMLIPAEGWNAAVQERAERAEAEVQRLNSPVRLSEWQQLQAEVQRLKQELDESRSDVCEPKCAALQSDNAKLRRVVEAAADELRRWAPNSVELIARLDAALADAGGA